MDFGKVQIEDLSRIDLRLPPDDPRTWESLETLDPLQSPSARRLRRFGLGCPVWAVKGWVGNIYPRGTDPKDFLHHYSCQFNTIELNTTHYRIPDEETIRRWREQTPDTFRFCPKWPQDISHRHPLWLPREKIAEFTRSVLGLEDRLGVSFLQLPPTFAPGDIEDLRRFLRELPREFPIAVEVRHPGFYDDHKLVTPLYDLLVEERAHVVITDVAGRRDVLHTSLSGMKVLIRFVGNDLHASDFERALEWIERLKTWISLGLEEVEFFVHQPGDKASPELISAMIPQLQEIAGVEVAAWKPQTTGEQLGWF